MKQEKFSCSYRHIKEIQSAFLAYNRMYNSVVRYHNAKLFCRQFRKIRFDKCTQFVKNLILIKLSDMHLTVYECRSTYVIASYSVLNCLNQHCIDS